VSAVTSDRVGEAARSRTLGSFLTSPWLTVRVRIALGLVFIVAALPKIVDPPAFAHAVYNYRILPGPFVNLVALTLPWLELLSGLALVLGLLRRAATVVIGGLLLVFLAGISLNLARKNPIDCGCFDPKAAGKSREERLADMRFVLVRDVGMLFLVAQSLAAARREDGGAA
jgi:uncharacterized membrane protein YphA (DoxX/SURF4 family)